MPNVNRGRVFVALAAGVFIFGLGWGCWPDDDDFRQVTRSLSPAARAAIGCWRFTKGSTYLDDRVPIGSIVALDSATDSEATPPKRYLLRVLPLDSANARSVRLSGWGISRGDNKRVLIFIGDGFSGVSMQLRLRDSMLSGTARAYTDVVPNFSFRHLVRARRVSCSGDGRAALRSMPPEGADAMR